MFLALVAFAVAFYALVKARDVADRVTRLEKDRDELLLKLEAQRKVVDQLRSPTRVASKADEPVAPVSKASAGTVTPVAEPRPEIAPPASRPAGESAPTQAPALEIPRLPSPANPPIAASLPTPQGAAPRPAAAGAPPRRAPISEPVAATPVDWESLLGVKGAAWVGGIALITSAILFARWSIEQGLVTPEFRFALMLFAGIGSLAAAELGLRRGYERTANPLSGAGIAILYIAFFAGHSRYDLISMPTAFGGMVAVTVTACVLAVRYDAFSTAVLGLIGGFTTPVALSTGVDRPAALFSYILLLNLGLFAVGLKRRWPALFELGLAGTLLIQIGWFSKFMSTGNMLVAVVTFFVFGILYLLLPIVAKDENNDRTVRTGILGGLAPFFFAVFIAGSSDYVDEWPLLFGLVLLLNLAILAFAVLRNRVSLLVSASLATALTLALWAGHGLKQTVTPNILGVTLFAIAIVSVFAAARRIALRFGDLGSSGLRAIEVASLIATSGLGVFGLIMLALDRGTPPGVFLMLLAAIYVFWLEHVAHPGRISGVTALGAAALATLAQIWFFTTVKEPTVAIYLAVPVVLSLLFSILAARETGGDADIGAEGAVILSSGISILGLFIVLAEKSLGANGFPLFFALAIHLVFIAGSVLRSTWTIILPAAMGAAAAHMLIWQMAYLSPEKHTLAFGFTALFYLFFLALPMVVPFVRWRESLLPWLTSALSGPFFFLPFYNVYKETFGESAIGLLPVTMAAVSVGALRVVSSRFAESPGDELSARLRLRYLALFTSVAMWFLAVAIPLQLDKQWITLGWALEAMALVWLYHRLPHRGLPLFAGLLYALVGARLLLNPEILQYHERSLPLFNWLLYTYGLAMVCCLVGQALLRRASESAFHEQLANAIALLGLLLGFWLVNLEILDYYSVGPFIMVSDGSGYAVKLALSGGWGLYAIVLLVAGVARDLKPLRYMSLAFLLLTVAKVFLYDLSELGGIFRVLSFLGLAIALILVSVFYQRFVFKKSS